MGFPTQCSSGGFGGELYTVSELEARSLSSRNTLGDTTHNTNKNLVKLGWRKCMVGKPMRKWWWWLMKKQPSLSSLNTLGDSSHNSNNHKWNGKENWLGCRSRWWLCGGCGGSPRQRCQSSKYLMKSNGYGSIFVGRGMSRAFQRAKEHENRTPDELVMDKTVKWGWLRCQVPDIRARGRKSGI